MKKGKRALVLMLSVFLMFSMLPASVFAEDPAAPETTTETPVAEDSAKVAATTVPAGDTQQDSTGNTEKAAEVTETQPGETQGEPVPEVSGTPAAPEQEVQAAGNSIDAPEEGEITVGTEPVAAEPKAADGDEIPAIKPYWNPWPNGPRVDWAPVEGEGYEADYYIVTLMKEGAASEELSPYEGVGHNSVTDDLADYAKANGAGKYSVNVKAYERAAEGEQDRLLAEGTSPAKDLYRVSIEKIVLDKEGMPGSGGGGCVGFDIDGNGGTECEDETTSFVTVNGGKIAHLDAEPDSTGGYLFKKFTVNGEETTESELNLELNRDYTITMTFQETERYTEVNLDLGHAGVGNDILNSIQTGDPTDKYAISDPEAKLSGTTITFKVLESWTNSDTLSALEEIIPNGEIIEDGEMLFNMYAGLKPASQYSSQDECIDDQGDSSVVRSGQKFYLLWFAPVSSVDIKVAAPVCGTEVKLSDEGGFPPRQENAPVVTADGFESMGAYWVDNNRQPFEGKINGDEQYNCYAMVRTAFGKYLADPDGITVNGEKATIIRADEGGCEFQAAITAEHEWDEGKVTKEATTTSKGVKTYTCKHCTATKTEEYGPLKEYTITYDLNGGTMDGKTGTVTVKAAEGSTITLPEPTRDGYVFDYWKGSAYNAGDKYTVTEDHTFTAQWVAAAEDDEDGDDESKSKGVKTGDATHLMGWLMLAIAAEAGAVYVYRKRRDY